MTSNIRDRKRRQYEKAFRDSDRHYKRRTLENEMQYRNRDGSSDRHRHRGESRDRHLRHEEDEHRYRDESSDHHRHRGESRDRHLRHDEDDHRYRDESSDHHRYRRGNRDRNLEQEANGANIDLQANQERTEDVKSENKEDKQVPNYETSGKLLEDTNSFNGVILKYNEPPEARKPKERWRLYPFKGDEGLKVIYIHRSSAFLIGREPKVADIRTDHPSISGQHAVLQFRLAQGKDNFIVKPYLIDLDSTNGTFLNGEKIESRRYYELKEKDCMKFGIS